MHCALPNLHRPPGAWEDEGTCGSVRPRLQACFGPWTRVTVEELLLGAGKAARRLARCVAFRVPGTHSQLTQGHGHCTMAQQPAATSLTPSHCFHTLPNLALNHWRRSLPQGPCLCYDFCLECSPLAQPRSFHMAGSFSSFRSPKGHLLGENFPN